MSCGDLFLGILAVLFPPIAVWIKTGLCSCDSLINILLCVLGYIPGLIHAWYIIAKYPERDYDQYERVDGGERGERVTYHYISQQGNNSSSNNNRQYGTQGTRPQQQNQQPKQPKPMAPPPPQSSRPQGSAGPSEGEASDGPAPPSYSDVVKGDNKVQTQD